MVIGAEQNTLTTSKWKPLHLCRGFQSWHVSYAAGQLFYLTVPNLIVSRVASLKKLEQISRYVNILFESMIKTDALRRHIHVCVSLLNRMRDATVGY